MRKSAQRQPKSRNRRLLRIVLLCLAAAGGQSAFARTIVVHHTADEGPGSLREALALASDGDKINIVAGGTIILSSGELVVDKDLTIRGHGADRLIIDADGASRVFHILPNRTVTIADLTITNGDATIDFPEYMGGGIFSDHADLTVERCVISGNLAGFGGGICSSSMDGGFARLTLRECTVRDNWAPFGFGGGIFSGGGFVGEDLSGDATLRVYDSRVIENSAGYGGGIFNDGFSGTATATINDSAVNDNLAVFNGVVCGGGGIYNNGDSGVAILRLTNSTVSGNSAGTFVEDPSEEHDYDPGIGGGIYNDGIATIRPGDAQVTLVNTTVSGNAALGDDPGSRGGGIFNDSRDLGRAAVTANRSNINDNAAEEGGGGIYNTTLAGEATITLTGSTVNGNVVRFGSSAITSIYTASEEDPDVHGHASVTLSDCAVRLNSGNGAAIRNNRAILTITGCDVSDNDGNGIINAGQDGPATATISDSVISRNRANIEGGGILSFANHGPATLKITNSIISQNHGRSGGGVANVSNVEGVATLNIDKSTVSNNHALTGGGILNDSFGGFAVAMISNSTLSGNSAQGDFTSAGFGFGGGGAVLNIQRPGVATLDLSNCTLSGNSTQYTGGAILNFADPVLFPTPGTVSRVTLDDCTLSGNSAVEGGNNIWNKSEIEEPNMDPDGPPFQPTLAIVDSANSIFDSGASGGNLQNISPGIITSRGYNLSSDAAGGNGSTGPGGFLNAAGDLRNTNPMLGPLRDNGGPTLTHGLLANSPAINAGDPDFNPDAFNPPLLYDQRSLARFPRVEKGRLDIGAFESKFGGSSR